MKAIHHCHSDLNTSLAGQTTSSDETSRGDSDAKENQTSEAFSADSRLFLQSV